MLAELLDVSELMLEQLSSNVFTGTSFTVFAKSNEWASIQRIMRCCIVCVAVAAGALKAVDHRSTTRGAMGLNFLKEGLEIWVLKNIVL